MFDSPANPDWPLAHVAIAVRAGHGDRYVFDLLDGTVEPASAEVEALAHLLQHDLARHLDARRIDRGWVTAATLEVSAAGITPGTRVPIRCRVTITDDRGTPHTSTRSGSMAIPFSGRSIRARIAALFRR